MKKNLLLVYTLAFISLLSCSKKEGRFSFKNSEDAVSGCRKALYGYFSQKDNSIEKIAEMTCTWLELQDSCYNTFIRDSTFDFTGELAIAFVNITDSIKMTIKGGISEQKRTLQDVMTLKLLTRKKVQNDSYKKVEDFYESLDKQKLYNDKILAIQKYTKLLNNITALSNSEDNLQSYLKEEDRCFQSVIHYMSSLTSNEMQEIIAKTTDAFKKSNWADVNAEIRELYFSMRFNRRVLQNAIVCIRDIKAGKKLTDEQSNTYRWMILQPLIAIGRDEMSVMTDKQISELKDILSVMPEIMIKLDGNPKTSPEEMMNLSQLLSSYFIDLYMSSIL